MRQEEKRMGKELQVLNQLIKDKYEEALTWKEKEFTQFLTERGGTLSTMERLKPDVLKEMGPVVGVDGSVNRKGGAHPHYVEIYRGLAKSTDGKEEYVEEIYTPLLDKHIKESFEETPIDPRRRILAGVELDVAIDFVKKHKVKILMMDGGLIRYKINDSIKWEELRNLCLNQGILLLGVIKDIKTNILSRVEGIYDREILFGNLPYGKVLFIDDDKNQKYDEGFSSAFLRPSTSIQVIGLDVPAEQGESLEELSNLVFSLTPVDGRGVPLWLDIVDAQAKISDKYMEAMLEEYLDREIYMRFFVSERDLRTMR
ncbi:MAG: DNA double-strand break repair nuclease NurA [Tissierellia bacterium]|nr:DNA double-strand break repair nuclease NurA [Tissierellia bacterium]